MKKSAFMLTAALCAAFAATARPPRAGETDRKLCDCICVLDETKASPNKAGWAFWFIPKGAADTLTVKMSSVYLLPGTHTPHSHNEDEGFYLAQGTAVVTLNGEERTIPAGSSFYCPGGSTHCIRRAGEEPIRYVVIKRETVERLETVSEPALKNYTVDDCIASPAPAGNLAQPYVYIGKELSGGMNVRMESLPPGDETGKEYRLPQQEAFYVVEGTAEVRLDGERERIGPNTSFYCPAGRLHGIRNAGTEPLRDLVIRTR